MKGQVLDYDKLKQTGIILAEDGNRYCFNLGEWYLEHDPQQGEVVDFIIQNQNAVKIYSAVSVNTSHKVNNSPKRGIAILLALFIGGLGAHKFYMGYSKQAWIMCIVWLVGLILYGLPSFIMGIIAFIELIKYLLVSDEEFNQIYIQGNKPWF